MDVSLMRVLHGHDQVAPYIGAVSAAADEHRESLGFLPRSVFEEFARRNDLFVLGTRKAGKIEYGGHLLFDRRFPRARVLQLLVLSEHRGQKYARLLCDRLVELLTRDGFTSIYARVGEDMRDANEAWQSMGFRVQRTELGGVTTGRMIVVRVRELESPQLFPPRPIDPGDPLGLSRSLSTEPPVFLVDLNVLFDLSPHRSRHEEAITLFQAERASLCKLAVSEETIVELARTGSGGRPDAMMNLVRTFTRFPVSPVQVDSAVVRELAGVVFPHKALASLSQNDASDLRHLVTAIENNLAGLVTSDEAILRAAAPIEARFDVQVLSPRAFMPEGPVGRHAMAYEVGDMALEVLPTKDSNEADVRMLLSKVGVTSAELATGWLSSASTSFLVRSRSSLLAYMTWSPMTRDGVTVRAAVDESAPRAVEVARGVITHCLNRNVNGPTTLRLKAPVTQVLLRDIGRGLGFCRGQGTSDLIKLAFGRVATKRNWHKRRSELAEISGLKMDGQFPLYRGIGQQVPYITRSGDPGYETLERLETLLSPALFCFPGRPAVITPIRHEYAKLLLGYSKQGSLLPVSGSNLFQERHFISGPNAFNHLKRGTLMFFYESNPPRGRGELVAIARVRQSYLKDAEALQAADFARSVLSTETIDRIGRAEIKTVTIFDNVFELPFPISLDRLRQLECGRPNDLITTRPIGDTQFQVILAEAFNT